MTRVVGFRLLRRLETVRDGRLLRLQAGKERVLPPTSSAPTGSSQA
jgi:hypothetical protein